MMFGTPLACKTGMKTKLLCPLLLAIALIPAAAHAQDEPEAASEAPPAEAEGPPAEAEATAEPEPSKAAPPAEAVAPSADEAASPKPAEPEQPPAPRPAAAPAEPSAPVSVATSSECECPAEPEQRLGRRHDGFYLRGSLGHGLMWAKFSEGLLADDRMEGHGGSFDLQMGGTLLPGFVLGGGLFISGMPHEDVRAADEPVDEDNPGSLGTIALGPFVDYYPDPESGFHFGIEGS